MPKYDADKVSLYEPIEIVLGGKSYQVEKITADMLSHLDELAAKSSGVDVAITQMAFLLGEQEEALRCIDIRKLRDCLTFIQKQVTGGEDAVGKTEGKVEAAQ